MKAGVGMSLFVVEALSKLNLALSGDLLFETVVDEEFGGVNGTLAGRLQGFNADAAIITEPSFLRVCPAQSSIKHLEFRPYCGVHAVETPTRQMNMSRSTLSWTQSRLFWCSSADGAAVPDKPRVAVRKNSMQLWNQSDNSETISTC
jgi:hypothetical protein